MKLHLPFGLRKALLSCLAAVASALPVTLASGTLAAEDITLGGESSIAPDEELNESIRAALKAAEQENALLIHDSSLLVVPSPLSQSVDENGDNSLKISKLSPPPADENTLVLNGAVSSSAELARQSLLRLKDDRLFSAASPIASDGVQLIDAPTATLTGVPGILAANNWGLVFEDQFDGTSSDDSALNTKLWSRIQYVTTAKPSSNWTANQSMDPSLVTFGDKDGNSAMQLWGKYGVYSNQNNQNNTTEEVYACGGIYSKGIFTFQHGYVEVRAKYQSAQGVWPAIWMMPKAQPNGWPASGEIDIMEHLFLNGQKQYYQTLHWWHSTKLDQNGNHNYDRNVSVASGGTDNNWHTYGVEWSTGSLAFYLDGKKTGWITWTADGSSYTLYGANGSVRSTVNNLTGLDQVPFDTDGNEFYLILDQQIGGGWPGQPNDASKKTLAGDGVSMWIDYVKVYSDVTKYNHLGSCTLTWSDEIEKWTEKATDDNKDKNKWRNDTLLNEKLVFMAADSVKFGAVAETAKNVTISGAVHATNMTVEAGGYTFSGEEGNNSKLIVRETLFLNEGETALDLNADIGRLSGAGNLNLATSGTGKTLRLWTWNNDYTEQAYTGTITVNQGWTLVISKAEVFAGKIDMTGKGTLAFDNNTDYSGNVVLHAALENVNELKGKGGWQVTIEGSVKGSGKTLTVGMYNSAAYSDCLIFDGDVSGFTGFSATNQMCNVSHFKDGNENKTIAAFTFKKGLNLTSETTFDVGTYSNTTASARHWIELTETSTLTGGGAIIKKGVGELEIDGNTSGYSGTMRLQKGKLILDGIDGTNASVSLENTTAADNVVNLNATKRSEAGNGGILKSVGFGNGATSGGVVVGANAKWTLLGVSLQSGQTLTISGATGSSITLGGDKGMDLSAGTLTLGAGVTFGGQLNITLTGSSDPTGLIDLQAGAVLTELKLNLVGLENVVEGWSYQLFAGFKNGSDVDGARLALAQEWLNQIELEGEYNGHGLVVDESGFISITPGDATMTWYASNPNGTVWKDGTTGWGETGADVFQGGSSVIFGATTNGVVSIQGTVTVNDMTVSGSYSFTDGGNALLKVNGKLHMSAPVNIGVVANIGTLSGNSELTINTGDYANQVTIGAINEFSGTIKLGNESRLTLNDTETESVIKLTGAQAYLLANNENLDVEAEGSGGHVLDFVNFWDNASLRKLGNMKGLSGIEVGVKNATVMVKDLTGTETFTFDNAVSGPNNARSGFSGRLEVTGSVSGYTEFVAKRAGATDAARTTAADLSFTGTVALGSTAKFVTTYSEKHANSSTNGTGWAPLCAIEFSSTSTITGSNTAITKEGEGTLKIAGDTSGLSGTIALNEGKLTLDNIDASNIEVKIGNGTQMNLLSSTLPADEEAGQRGILKKVSMQAGDSPTGSIVLGANASWTVQELGLQAGQTLAISGETGSRLQLGGESGVTLSGGTLTLGAGVAFSGKLTISLTGSSTLQIGLTNDTNFEELQLNLTGLATAIGGTSTEEWELQLFSFSTPLTEETLARAQEWVAKATLDSGYESYKLSLKDDGKVYLDPYYLVWDTDGTTWKVDTEETTSWKGDKKFESEKSVMFEGDGNKTVTVEGTVSPKDMTVSGSQYTFKSGTDAKLAVTGTLLLEDNTTTTLELNADIEHLSGGSNAEGATGPTLVIQGTEASAVTHGVWIKDAEGYNGKIQVKEGGLMLVKFESGSDGIFSVPHAAIDLSGGGVLAFDNNNKDNYVGDITLRGDLTGVTQLQGRGGWQVTIEGTVQSTGNLTVGKYNKAEYSDCFVFAGNVSGFTGFATTEKMYNTDHSKGNTIAAFTFEKELSLTAETTFNVGVYSNKTDARHWIELTETSTLTGGGNIIKTGAGELEIDGDTSGYSGIMKLQGGKLILDGIDGGNVSVSLEDATADANALYLNGTKRPEPEPEVDEETGAETEVEPLIGSILKNVTVTGSNVTNGKVIVGAGASWELHEVSISAGKTLTITGEEGSSITLGAGEESPMTLAPSGGTLALGRGVTFTGWLSVDLTGATGGENAVGLIGLEDGTNFTGLYLSITGLPTSETNADSWKYKLFSGTLSDNLLADVQSWLKMNVSVGTELADSYRLSVNGNGEIYLRSMKLTWATGTVIWTEGSTQNKWANDALFESGDQVTFGTDGAGTVLIDGTVQASAMNVNADGYTFSAQEGDKDGDKLLTETLTLTDAGIRTRIELPAEIAALNGGGTLIIATDGEASANNVVTITEVGGDFTGTIELADKGRLTLNDNQYNGTIKLTGATAYLKATNKSLHVTAKGSGQHVLSFFQAQQIGDATGLSGICVGGDNVTTTVENLTAGAGGTTFTFDNSHSETADPTNTSILGWAGYSGRLTINGTVSGYTAFVAKHAGDRTNNRTNADIRFNGEVRLGRSASFETTFSTQHRLTNKPDWAALSIIEFSSDSNIEGTGTKITKTGAGTLKIAGDTSGLSGTLALSDGKLALESIDGSQIDVTIGYGAENDAQITLSSRGTEEGGLKSVQLGEGVTSGKVALSSGATWTLEGLGVATGQTLTIQGGTNTKVTFGTEGDVTMSGGTLALEGGTYSGSLALTLGDVETNGAQITIGSGVTIDEVKLNIVVGMTDAEKLKEGWEYQLFNDITQDQARQVTVEPNDELRKKGCTFTVDDSGKLTVKRLAERYWNGTGGNLEWGGDTAPWTDEDGEGAYAWESEDVWEDRDYMDVHFTATNGNNAVNLVGDIVADEMTIDGGSVSYTFSGGHSLTVNKSLTSGAGADLTVGGGVSISVGANAAAGGDLTVNSGTVSVEGKATVGGSLAVNGGAVSVGTGSSAGSLAVQQGGTFTAKDNFTVGGALDAQGTVNLEGTAAVNGALSVGSGDVDASSSKLTVSGELKAGSMTVQNGSANLRAGGTVNGDVTLWQNGSLTVNGTLNIGNEESGALTADGGSLTIEAGGKVVAQSWGGSLSSLTLNDGSSVTAKGLAEGVLGFGTLTLNGDSDLVLEGLTTSSYKVQLKVDEVKGSGLLRLTLTEDFLSSVAGSGKDGNPGTYELFAGDLAHLEDAIVLTEEAGFTMTIDWETGTLTVGEIVPEVEPDRTYTSSEANGGSGGTNWQKKDENSNIYYDVYAYETVDINRNTTIDLTGEKYPEHAFGEAGLVLHNLCGDNADANLSVVGSANGGDVTLQDWESEDEESDNRVVYSGGLKISNAKLRIDHGKRGSDDEQALNKRKAANVTSGIGGVLDLSEGNGLEMICGVLELSAEGNKLGSKGITFTNGFDAQLLLSGGSTIVSGDIVKGADRTLAINRGEHIRLCNGATLTIGDQDPENTSHIGEGMVIGNLSASNGVRAAAETGDEAEERHAETVIMQGNVEVAKDARVTGVHLWLRAADVTWNSEKTEELYGLIATGGKFATGTDVRKNFDIYVTEWSEGTDNICSGTDFSEYSGTMSIHSSEYNQVFTHVKGSKNWNMDVQGGGKVVFDVLDGDGRNAAWEMGNVTLQSGATLTLYFTLAGPTALRATSSPGMTFHTFVMEEGARLALHSDGYTAPTEETYVLGTVEDDLNSGIGQVEITPQLSGMGFWHVDGERTRVYMEGNELKLKIALGGSNRILDAMEPDANDNARAGAEALWELTGMTDNARIMRDFNDPNSDLAKLANDTAVRCDTGDAKGLEKLMAAAVGTSLTGVAPALAQDMHRQLSAIRNRTATMGTDVGLADDADDFPIWHAWINAESGYHELDDDGLETGYRLNGWGGTVGMDADVSFSTTVGLAVSAMYNDLKSGGADSMNSDLDTYYVSGFLRHMSGRWTHTVVLSAGMASLDSKRTVALTGGSYTANGDTDGYALGALYEIGYTHAVDPERVGALQSVFNVEFRHVSLGGFDEEGSAAALRVDDMEQTVVTFGAGVRYQRLLGAQAMNRTALLELRALAKVDAGDTRGEAVTNFLDATVKNRLRGAEIGRVGAEIGAGITVPVGPGSVFVDGSLELRSGYTSFDASAGYRIMF